jgi:hypothetical protein
MLILLVARSFSDSLYLTDSNFTNIYEEPDRLGLFVIFWGPDCHNCHHLYQPWKDFAHDNRYLKDVIFAETNCSVSPKFCSEFGEFIFPHAAYIDFTTKDVTHFEGSYDSLDYAPFLDQRLSIPITFLSANARVPQPGNWSTFVLTYVDLNDERFEYSRLAFVEFRDWNCSFFAIPGDDWSLKALRSSEFTVAFRESWEYPEILAFVQANVFPLVCEFTDDRQEQLKLRQMKTVLSIIVPHLYLAEFAHLAEKIESPYPFMYVVYNNKHPMLPFFGVKREHVPLILLYDPSGGRWIHYNGVLGVPQVSDWLGTVNINSVIWNGPKESIKESLLHTLLDDGLMSLAVLAMVGFGLCKLIKEKFTLKPRNRRPSDFKFSQL